MWRGMNKLQPHLDRIIIKPDVEHTSNKLVIPEAFKKMANRGEVVSVGPGRRHIDGKLYEPPFKPGDRVMFGQLNAFKFTFNEEALVMVHSEDVLAKIEGGIEGN